uniref:Transmembrane protein n=1 Tax=Strongyloides stercoralis TaxID=6248 RepID=A0A0K0ENI3_STRER
MILTPVPSYFEKTTYKSSTVQKHSYTLDEKLGIKNSLKNATILLIIVNFFLLIGMYFFCFFNFIIQAILISIEFLCIYKSIVKKNNLKAIKIFIFIQFVNNVYTVFSFIVIIVGKTIFGYDFYNYQNKKVIFTTLDKIIIIFIIIIICYKIIFLNYYSNIYKLLIWQQEHINKMNEIQKNCITQVNNANFSSPPKLLVIPEIKNSNKNERLSPIHEENNKVGEISTKKRRSSKVIPKLSLQISPTSYIDSSSPLTPFDITYTSDFYLIPLNTPYNLDVKLSIFDEKEKKANEKENNEIDNDNEKENNVLRRYFISLSDVSTVDNKGYFIDRINNPIQQNDLEWI